MLTTVLAAIKLLVDALKGQFTSDKKRERLAKDLFKVYLDLDEIVRQGRELVSYVAPDRPIAKGIPIEALRSQQMALETFQRHLDRVAAILDLHLPSRTGRLEVFMAFKSLAIALLLTFLVDRPQIGTDEADLSSPEMRKLIDECKRLGLDWEPAALILLPDKTWTAEPDFHMALIASPADIEAARRALDSIAGVQEELRLFLVEKFKIEDVL